MDEPASRPVELERLERGESLSENENGRELGGPQEKAADELPTHLHTWPHLVRVEVLVAVAVMALLIIWSVGIDAPLEEAANPNRTPNPSKAPWYFLGLQEMLVYFDPWMAGVVIPLLIIVGLAAIPYLDVNPKGNGYYTFRERTAEILTFNFGFLVLWISLIAVGVFLRGPGWNFFAPWEAWDPHKVVPLTNVNLWEYFGVEQRSPMLGAVFGGLTVLLYYLAPSWIVYRRLRKKGSETLQALGRLRYAIVAFLFLTMMMMPLKMVLRWVFNIKYFWVWPGVLNL